MQNTNFLCIDDQQDNTVDSLLTLLRQQATHLTIDRMTPLELAAQVRHITSVSKSNDNFGLLLDLRLDQEATSEHSKVPYRGPTLAQELRTRMTEKKIPSFPIVLWSITEKFVKSFDESSQDLFDAVFGKDDQIIDHPELVAGQMLSLVDGYARISSNKKARLSNMMLGFKDSPVGVHETFLEEFKYFVESKAVHEISSYLLNHLILPSGLLVNESLLAARLGIDISKSGSSWNQLLEELEITKYKGPFASGWPRWWWFSVEIFWSELTSTPPNLRRIGAAERVKILNQNFGLSLKPAAPLKDGYSDRFFCLCVATGNPIDPSDGFRVAEINVKPWQDTSYVSAFAALNRIQKSKWRISPLDRDRFDRLKKS